MEGWLYSIKEDRIRLGTKLTDLANLESQEPSLRAVDYQRDRVTGGEYTSEPERYALRVDKWLVLKRDIEKLQARLNLFDRVLDELSTEDPTYRRLYEVKYGKFRSREDKPTDAALAREIGCSKRTFYRRRKELVRRFSEARKKDGTISTGKSRLSVIQ